MVYTWLDQVIYFWQEYYVSDVVFFSVNHIRRLSDYLKLCRYNGQEMKILFILFSFPWLLTRLSIFSLAIQVSSFRVVFFFFFNHLCLFFFWKILYNPFLMIHLSHLAVICHKYSSKQSLVFYIHLYYPFYF